MVRFQVLGLPASIFSALYPKELVAFAPAGHVSGERSDLVRVSG